MKKSVIKTIATLTLALSLVMTGAVAAEGVAHPETMQEEIAPFRHDGPDRNGMVI